MSEIMNKVVELGRAGKWQEATDHVRSPLLFVKDVASFEYVSAHSKEFFELPNEFELMLAELEHIWGSSHDEWGMLGKADLLPNEELTFKWDHDDLLFYAYREEDGEEFRCLEDGYMAIDLAHSDASTRETIRIAATATAAYENKDFSTFWSCAKGYKPVEKNPWKPEFVDDHGSLLEEVDDGQVRDYETAQTLYSDAPSVYRYTYNEGWDTEEPNLVRIDPAIADVLSRAFALIIDREVTQWGDKEMDLDWINALYNWRVEK